MRFAFLVLAGGLALPVQAQTIGTATPIPPSTGINTSQGIPLGATIPRVVSTTPANGQNNVNANVREIRITFDQPMDVATFYWPVTVQADFPNVTGQPVWSNGNRTVSLPVSFAPNSLYRIPLNVTTKIFRSAHGVYLEPGMISFSTGSGSKTTYAKPSTFSTSPGFNTTPRNNQSVPSTGGVNTSVGGTSVAPTPISGGSGVPSGASVQGARKTKSFGSRRATPTPR